MSPVVRVRDIDELCACNHCRSEHERGGPCRARDSYGSPCECPSFQVVRDTDDVDADLDAAIEVADEECRRRPSRSGP